MFIVTTTCSVILGICVAILGLLHYVKGDWKDWKQSTCFQTNTCFCETITLDVLIRQKANTWTNLAYVF
jgi:hypothetical protein